MSLFLVDGTFEIFRCYHAADHVRNSDGQEVGASRAFFHTITSLLREDSLTHIAIAFDSVVSRVDRGDRSDSALIRSQFPIAADIARALGITIWPMSRYEADDALATAANRFQDAADIGQIIICSNDNDFAQCVRGNRIVRLNRITKEYWDEQHVIAKFGVQPHQIPEYLALVGDPSDGIPGIPGYGPKSAAVVIGHYGRIEDIPEDSDAWDVSVRGKDKLASVLAERRNEALLYRNLSTLKTDVPLPEPLSDLAWSGADRSAVEEIAARLEAPTLLERTIHYAT